MSGSLMDSTVNAFAASGVAASAAGNLAAGVGAAAGTLAAIATVAVPVIAVGAAIYALTSDSNESSEKD